MSDRCTNIAPANEYWTQDNRCERKAGHDGPHTREIGPVNWRRTWQDVAFKMNYKEHKGDSQR